ncbi:MAG TPA: RdgB/HAM1 family non-canonical purine NTP pyrophosphatase [Herpetosiphonaceae bacterium]
MQTLLIATTNQHKFTEYIALLDNLPFKLVSLSDVGISDDVEETGDTFKANAQLKAEAYSQRSGLLTLADDSGLEIAALNGAPGVYSARYGGVTGAAQLALVLKQLEGLPFHERMARFVCVIAIAEPGKTIHFVEGTVPGAIENAPKGTNGFGYDPIFYLLDRGVTMAELPAEEKNRISHRAQAVKKARAVLLEMAANSNA